MADSPALKPGTIPHIDITIPNAEEVRDFYHSVVGWEVKAASQGDYDDYNMIATSTGQPVSGICHARGQRGYAAAVVDLHRRRRSRSQPCRVQAARWRGHHPGKRQ